ncbi:unnamed protein product [Somion occarium]|uniref:Uncharacterized protein n=1 Tax=Somion occarium TaxID=3059160 RepID=A0ABP1CM59_9APHY
MDDLEPERISSPPPVYELMPSHGSISIDQGFDQVPTVTTNHHEVAHSSLRLPDDRSSGFASHREPSIFSDVQSLATSSISPMSSPPNGMVSPSPTRSTHRYSNASAGSRSIRADATYTFQPTGFNCMDLVASHPLSGPSSAVYHVDISFNCFNPTSFITAVRRGGLREGEFVAKFEMGISTDRARLQFHDYQECDTEQIFYPYRNVGSNLSERWCWKRSPLHLQWDSLQDHTGYFCCKDPSRNPSKTSLATLVHNGQSTSTALWVSAAGHEIFDDIFISALLVERKRLSPRKGTKNEQLFNHKSHGDS